MHVKAPFSEGVRNIFCLKNEGYFLSLNRDKRQFSYAVVVT
jgi:hypothetical protein